jgi:hypothetical protein
MAMPATLVNIGTTTKNTRNKYFYDRGAIDVIGKLRGINDRRRTAVRTIFTNLFFNHSAFFANFFKSTALPARSRVVGRCIQNHLSSQLIFWSQLLEFLYKNKASMVQH